MRYINRITGIEGVVSGGLATFSLPTGPRYHALKLSTFLDGAPEPYDQMIDRVRLKVNEISIWDVSAASLYSENGMEDQSGSNNAILPLFFSNPARADKVDEALTAWDTFGERSFKVELQLKSGLVGVPTIVGQSIFDYGATIVNGQRVKTIVKKTEATFNAPSGFYDIDTLNIRYPILRLLMKKAADDINEVEVTADSVRVLETTKAQNTQNLLDYGLDASLFAFPICFDYTEQLTDFLEVSKSLNVRVNSTASGAITVIQHSVAPGFM